MMIEEEIFGSIEEELETYRSIPFPKAVLKSLRDARHYKFDEVVTILLNLFKVVVLLRLFYSFLLFAQHLLIQ